MTSGEGTTSDAPVERFKPSSGFIVGYAGLLLVAVVVVYVVVSVHTVTGLRVALGTTFFGLVIWVTQLRSRATAYADRLLLRNSLRDVAIPLVLIEDVSVRQTLNVWVAERRYVCIGIGRSLRTMFKNSRSGGGSSVLGTNRWREFAERAERAAPDQTSASYETFVVTRIQELVDQARNSARTSAGTSAGTSHAGPVYRFAWPEIVALVVVGAAFGVSLTL